MKLTILACLLSLASSRAWARDVEDAAPESVSALPFSRIETVIPNRSYLIKLDCISCPYLIRHSNRNEWEQDPRPTQLTLTLYIDGSSSHLYLQGETLNPLWYERRAPSFYNLPHPFAPPFTANQIGTNATLQQEENDIGYGMPIRQFELAYEYDMVTYAPKDRVREWEVLIQLEIKGLRHEEHEPKDIPFFGKGVDQGKRGSIPGVTSTVRLALGYSDLEEMEITALELMPKDGMAEFAPEAIEVLRKAAEVKGDKSITTTDWGGRMHDAKSPDGKNVYTEHVSFQPGEWNDCGRKDEWGRQIMCKVDDLKAWSPALFTISLILVGILVVGMNVSILFVSWHAVRFLCGKGSGEVVAAEGESDALLLFGDEELEVEEEKAEKDSVATQSLDQATHIDDGHDSRQSGPISG